MQIIEAESRYYKERKGDYKIAERLIRETNWTNEEIALDSGISLERVPALRFKIRKQQRKHNSLSFLK